MAPAYSFVPWKHIGCQFFFFSVLSWHFLTCWAIRDCYSIEPWMLKWSKQIRTRMWARFPFNWSARWLSLWSAHADLQENCLAISNLDNGVDIYSLPSMQLMKNYSHGGVYDRIFKVAFVADGELVSGGKGGSARLYSVHSGQLLQTLEHDEGELGATICM